MADVVVTINTPHLDGLVERLSPASRGALFKEVEAELSETVRDHLRDYALTHHATAQRLGARPTGNLEDAKVTSESGAGGATVTVAAKGIRRALGDILITPRSKSALTIPVDAKAYGRSVSYLKSHGVKLFRPKGKNYIATTEGKGRNAKVKPLFVLVKRAKLKHEPGLLPTDEALTANARAAALEFLMEKAS